MLSLAITSALIGSGGSGTGGRPILDLWPRGNPGGWTRPDKEVSEFRDDSDFKRIGQVSHPTLEIFRSSTAKKGAPTVLVCPGGGYWIVAIEHEGWEIAERLNKAGIHAAVLKYRIPIREKDNPIHLVPLQDAQRAMRILRARAGELGIGGGKVGIMGFSAGGHLAAVASTATEAAYPREDAIDDVSPTPDFTILGYAAYLTDDGKPLEAAGVRVTAKSPPAFLVHAADDHIPVAGSLAYASALGAAKVPVEVHVYPKGGHGYGLRSKEAGLKEWPDLMIAWIRRLG